jgi:hypothetical protein
MFRMRWTGASNLVCACRDKMNVISPDLDPCLRLQGERTNASHLDLSSICNGTRRTFWVRWTGVISADMGHLDFVPVCRGQDERVSADGRGDVHGDKRCSHTVCLRLPHLI